jgi:hypothetical protein
MLWFSDADVKKKKSGGAELKPMFKKDTRSEGNFYIAHVILEINVLFLISKIHSPINDATFYLVSGDFRLMLVIWSCADIQNHRKPNKKFVSFIGQ